MKPLLKFGSCIAVLTGTPKILSENSIRKLLEIRKFETKMGIVVEDDWEERTNYSA